MIFDGQNAIHNTVRLLHQRLDEVIGRQERTLSQLTLIQSGGGGAAGGGHHIQVCVYKWFVTYMAELFCSFH